MNQIQRLKQIYVVLLKSSCSYSDIIVFFEKQNYAIGIRQLQRDFKELHLLLKSDENLIKYRSSEKNIHFKILKVKVKSSKKIVNIEKNSINSNFFNLLSVNLIDENLTIINEAFNESKNILIKELRNDVTGDNHNFNQKNIKLIPIKIIKHRGSIYLGGFNIKKKKLKSMIFYN
jgi:hypothetical protein